MPVTTLLILAQHQAEAAGYIAEGVVLMIVGMAVVFCALLLLMAVIAGIKRTDAAPATASTAPKPAAPSTPAPSRTATEEMAAGISPQTIAVLAAAATAALRQRVRIQRVNVLSRGGRTGGAWTQSGRRTIMTSHRPRRR